MEPTYTFPFGQPLKKVMQTDVTPKKVFILGVYASAVHAKWISNDGKLKVNALAVASEPYIFWKGDGVEEIIKNITIPEGAGKLVPADRKFNGPSGIALDNLYLRPLGLSRKDVWLCDLLPYSRVNQNQRDAIQREYNPLIPIHQLPQTDIPDFSKHSLISNQRREEILDELALSQADTIILLGDLPIKSFLRHFDSRFTNLSELSISDYGKEVKVIIKEKLYSVISLCHPRQAAQLGRHSTMWNQQHNRWIESKSNVYEITR